MAADEELRPVRPHTAEPCTQSFRPAASAAGTSLGLTVLPEQYQPRAGWPRGLWSSATPAPPHKGRGVAGPWAGHGQRAAGGERPWWCWVNGRKQGRLAALSSKCELLAPGN